MYTNKINDKKYIGQTYRSLKTRAGMNGHNYKNCKYFYNAIQKYGFDTFESRILASNLTKEQADKFEKLMIKTFGTTNQKLGYNITKGGAGRCEEREYEDLSGKRFGMLTVVQRIYTDNRKETMWFCKCDCGGERTIGRRELLHGKNPSCGCTRYSPNFEHGLTGTRLYNLWINIRSKCKVPTHKGYDKYGQIGIDFYSGWDDFLSFKKWADETGYNENKFLHRKNIFKDFNPENCFWDNKIQSCTFDGRLYVNLTNKELFLKVQDAMQKYNLKSKESIFSACRGTTQTAAKCKWRYYDDYLKENNLTDEEARKRLFFIWYNEGEEKYAS